MAVQEFTQTIAGLTTAATPYTTGDQLGNVLTFPDVSKITGGLVNLVGITITDDSGVLGALDAVVFAAPSTTPPTLAADNAVAALSAADNQKVRAVASIATVPLTGGRAAVNWLPLSGAQIIKLADGDLTRSLHVGLIARSANAVFAAGANSLRVSLLIDRN